MLRATRWIATIFVLASLVLASPQTWGAQETNLLNDLPEEATRYLVKRYVVKTLAEAQLALINHYIGLASPLERSEMEQFLGFTHDALRGAEAHTEGGASPQVIPSLAIVLYDPRPLAAEVAGLKRSVEDPSACPGLRLHQSASDERSERHNFFVWYLRSIHGLCEGEIDWMPSKRLAGVEQFYGMHRGPDMFGKMHAYLENPMNRPFTRRGNFSLLFYVHYLSLAFEAKYISMAFLEFLSRYVSLSKGVAGLDIDYARDLLSIYPQLRDLHSILGNLLLEGLTQ